MGWVLPTPFLFCSLNQVIMNLIANAIDALEDSNKGKEFAEIEAKPNKITISTNS